MSWYEHKGWRLGRYWISKSSLTTEAAREWNENIISQIVQCDTPRDSGVAKQFIIERYQTRCAGIRRYFYFFNKNMGCFNYALLMPDFGSATFFVNISSLLSLQFTLLSWRHPGLLLISTLRRNWCYQYYEYKLHQKYIEHAFKFNPNKSKFHIVWSVFA